MDGSNNAFRTTRLEETAMRILPDAKPERKHMQRRLEAYCLYRPAGQHWPKKRSRCRRPSDSGFRTHRLASANALRIRIVLTASIAASLTLQFTRSWKSTTPKPLALRHQPAFIESALTAGFDFTADPLKITHRW